MEAAGIIVIFIGTVFLCLGALGIVRMPDVYNRLQAGTKATTLGAMLVFFGVGVYDFAYLPKAVLLVILTVIGNPLVSSLIAKSAHEVEVDMSENTQFDRYQEDTAKQPEES